MPHAETHTVVLPHAMAYNAPYVVDAAKRIATALEAPAGVSAAQALFDLAQKSGAPTSLKELGFKEADLEKCADIAAKAPYPNPAPRASPLYRRREPQPDEHPQWSGPSCSSFSRTPTTGSGRKSEGLGIAVHRVRTPVARCLPTWTWTCIIEVILPPRLSTLDASTGATDLSSQRKDARGRAS
jgi:hypothetical protein